MNFAPDSVGLSDMLRQTEGASLEEQKSNLRMFADANVNPAAKQKANYVLARLLQKHGARADLEDAVARYKVAAAFEPLFERSQLHIAESAGILGDEKQVREALDAIANSKSVEKKAKMAALYGLGQSYMRTGEAENARQYFQQVAASDPESQWALGSSYYLATMDLARDTGQNAGPATAGDTKLMSAESPAAADALEQFRKYLQASADGRFAEDIVLQMKHLPDYVATPADHELFAEVAYAHQHYAAALAEWRAAGNTTDWYKQAICMFGIGKPNDAKAMLMAGIRNHPNDDEVEDAAIKLARVANRQGAIDVWNAVRASSSRFGDVALYNLGTRAPSTTAALPYYGELVTKYPTSSYAPDAQWWLAWADINSGRGLQALPKLQAGAARYPESRAGTRFAYWIGKIQERLGKKDLAKAAYERTITMQPWNYYAYRAQSRLKALTGGKDEGWRTVPQRKVSWSTDTADQWEWPEPPIDLAKTEGNTITTLTELRQWDECLDLVDKHANALRAFYLAKIDQPLPAINSAVKALKGKPEKTELWELAYPLLHAKQIAKEGPRKRVDPFLIQALIREESRYNAGAISSSNALGLMQLLPGTAYGVAKRLGIPLKSREDIHDPTTNITLGTDYLSYVHHRFNGNSLFAVASYNGGPNAVAKWSKNMPPDTDTFVENIPYRETRDYVRKVFASYWNYRIIYGS